MDTENNKETKKKLKKKRKRTVITAEEMVILESSFKMENRPDRLSKMRLAKQMGKTEGFISIWFQNRRARERREKKLSVSGNSGDDSHEPVSFRTASSCQTTEKGDSEDQPLDLTKKTSAFAETKETRTEMPVVRSPMFSRLIRMAAAAEGGILTTDCPFVGQAVTDACRGILLQDGRLLYDPASGFEIVLHQKD
ncbi:paired box protein Pax-6-like [Mercenaria mercenaria]|uniref:paired box protein Pax-6-like n=1 Tax=Mercenaria mercenaria TaxID=6596 RepID=UPI001E1D590C|nr:paired box protein Pax-6-like [Mercenaria mercenaria]